MVGTSFQWLYSKVDNRNQEFSRTVKAAMAASSAPSFDNPRMRALWKRLDGFDAELHNSKMLPFVDECAATSFVLRVSSSVGASGASSAELVDIMCNKQSFTAQSDHFAAMFSSGFSEGSASSDNTVVNVEGDADAYRDLTRVIHGAVFPVEVANLIHLFALADMYRMNDCCKSIHRRLLSLCDYDSSHALATVSNIPADTKGRLRQIRAMALDRVVVAGAVALESDAWLDVPADAALDILREPLNATEVEILDAVLRWIHHREGMDCSAAGAQMWGASVIDPTLRPMCAALVLVLAARARRRQGHHATKSATRSRSRCCPASRWLVFHCTASLMMLEL